MPTAWWSTDCGPVLGDEEWHPHGPTTMGPNCVAGDRPPSQRLGVHTQISRSARELLKGLKWRNHGTNSK